MVTIKKLAEISKKFDRGYGHFTTRQNIQFNWPKLTDVPKILEELASVEMHAIKLRKTIRNISCDHLAGINNEEVEDPRPWCEIIEAVVNISSKSFFYKKIQNCSHSFQKRQSSNPST